MRLTQVPSLALNRVSEPTRSQPQAPPKMAQIILHLLTKAKQRQSGRKRENSSWRGHPNSTEPQMAGKV